MVPVCLNKLDRFVGKLLRKVSVVERIGDQVVAPPQLLNVWLLLRLM